MNSMPLHFTYRDDLLFGHHGIAHAEEIIDELMDLGALLVDADVRKDAPPLNGRGGAEHCLIPHYGRVVLKTFHRGGLLRFVNRQSFIRTKEKGRSQKEFEVLEKVRSLGVNAPKPLFFIETRKSLYKAWLLMEEIEGGKTLSALSTENEDIVRKVFPGCMAQIEILIRNKIFHIDLHPGNMMIDGDEKPWIIDFDRAKELPLSSRQLRDLYLRRWRRAVIKHKLPDYLSELASAGLRKILPDEEGYCAF